jgi:hypothetical protein
MITALDLKTVARRTATCYPPCHCKFIGLQRIIQCPIRYRTWHSFFGRPLVCLPNKVPLVSSFFDKAQMMDLLGGCRPPNVSRNCCWHDIKEMPGSVASGTNCTIIDYTYYLDDNEKSPWKLTEYIGSKWFQMKDPNININNFSHGLLQHTLKFLRFRQQFWGNVCSRE